MTESLKCNTSNIISIVLHERYIGNDTFSFDDLAPGNGNYVEGFSLPREISDDRLSYDILGCTA